MDFSMRGGGEKVPSPMAAKSGSNGIAAAEMKPAGDNGAIETDACIGAESPDCAINNG